ncbi:hypothetical protein BRC89_12470 [Halobacteriales archaeon QS_4_70_19]|nr:MAG: hypothetical protein BRC89_12470 [Halobacteriales archaeon QS_4_70_19]
MSEEHDSRLSDATRRAILKGVGATLGVSAVGGVASGHPGSGDHGNEDHDHAAVDEFQMSTVGYHSLGGIGSESVSGSSDEPHYGGISELRIHGDIAAVGILSSKEPTVDRGVAILDVSAYTRAESRAELERAEMTVLSFVPNENNTTSVMDVKFSGDGDYLFLTQQPVAGLFAATAGNAPEARTEGESASNPSYAGVLAVDLSEPGDPEIVGRTQFGFGMHNCYHHRIAGEDYLFCVSGDTGDPAGIFVLRFDRTSGDLEKVNFWSHDTDARQGEAGDPTTEFSRRYYAHDITVIDDPATGTPFAYLANWNSGARVLDVSDPTDIEELGRFKMERAHTIGAVRRTVDGKRLFVVGQENPDPDSDTGSSGQRDDLPEPGHTGHFYLVDATGVENGQGSTDLGEESAEGGDSTDGGELAKWRWKDDIQYDNYTYSAHNIDTVDTEVNGQRRLFVTVGHYHAGTRLLEIDFPGRSGPPVRDEDGGSGENGAISEGGLGSGNGTGMDDGWYMAETGWSRTHNNVVDEAKFGSLSAATPYHWCAIEENGVVFASCISTGVYAMTLDDPRSPIPVGTRTAPDVRTSIETDGSVFRGGATDQIDISISTQAPVEVRFQLPPGWSVAGGDHTGTWDVGDGTLVEFGEVDGDADLRLFATAPSGDSVRSQTLGPLSVTTDVGAARDQQVWKAVPDTEQSVVVLSGGLSF